MSEHFSNGQLVIKQKARANQTQNNYKREISKIRHAIYTIENKTIESMNK